MMENLQIEYTIRLFAAFILYDHMVKKNGKILMTHLGIPFLQHPLIVISTKKQESDPII